MSGERLSADRIAELFESARQGELTDEQPRHAQRRPQRLRPVDFSRPTKFTNDEQRRLARSLEAFCRSASTRLSAELRAPLELEVINTSQLNWAHAHGQLPPSSICGIVEARPLQTTLLIGFELPLVLSAIDLLLGGTVDAPPPDRRLTEIDWALARHFITALLGQLSVIWTDMAGVELALQGVETHLETAQVAPVSEPTMTLTLEARLGRASSTVGLLVPYASVASMLASLSADDRHGPGDDPQLAEAVGAAVRAVDVVLRAEVAAIELPAEQVLALRPGDVLGLGSPASAGATLYADQVPLCRVRPGRSGRRRAVQVLGEGAGP